jgi:hypothetical protein
LDDDDEERRVTHGREKKNGDEAEREIERKGGVTMVSGHVQSGLPSRATQSRLVEVADEDQ